MRKTRIEQVAKPVIYQTVCDHCGKAEGGEDPEGWHHFSTGHSDWGNDSIESFEQWDACSGSCYLALLKQVVEDYDPKVQGAGPTLNISSYDFDLGFAKSLLEAS